jgi:hypothetical protein
MVPRTAVAVAIADAAIIGLVHCSSSTFHCNVDVCAAVHLYPYDYPYVCPRIGLTMVAACVRCAEHNFACICAYTNYYREHVLFTAAPTLREFDGTAVDASEREQAVHTVRKELAALVSLCFTAEQQN